VASLTSDCPFCGALSVEINEEHVIAEWILKIIRKQRSPDARYRVVIQRGASSTAHWRYKPETVIQAPCKEVCNGGWMKQLEDGVRPFFGAMIANGELTFLSRDRAAMLCMWTVKTVMNYEFAEPPPRPDYFSGVDRQAMRLGHLPLRPLWIWIGHYDGPRPISVFPLPLDMTLVGGARFSARCVTLIVGRVVLQVLALPAGYGGNTLPIQPRPGPWHKLIPLLPYRAQQPKAWPPVHEFDEDDLELLATRFLAP
jgi:hypothetical protein